MSKLSDTLNSKYLLIHADDAGLSHAENRATIELLKNDSISSYSIMTPCPWFFEMALFQKNNPEFDMGIHLTLTCEWYHYKFGPVLPVSEVPSLTDDMGHFFRTRDLVREHVKPEDVEKEFHAQIQKALDFGLKPTHIDSHMYTAGVNPELFELYKEMGKIYGLPVFINRELLEFAGLDTKKCINENDFLIEQMHIADFDLFKKGNMTRYYDESLDHLKPGINIMIIHPAFDDNEMQAITIDHPNFGSEWRQIDFDYFISEKFKRKMKENKIQLITWEYIHNHFLK